MKLVAWFPNNLGKSSGAYVVDGAHFDGNAKYRVLGHFQNYQLVRQDHSVFALYKGAAVGVVDISPFGRGLRMSVMSAGVRPPHQGKGLGFALYEAALGIHGQLDSSSYLSRGSSLAWMRLCHRHHGMLIVGDHGAEHQVAICGWVQVKGYWVPQVRMPSGAVTNLFKLMTAKSKQCADAAEEAFYRIHK